MAIGVLNPADKDHATASRPTATLTAVNQRRWFSDFLNTEIRDQDFNAIIGQIRHCIDHWAIPDVEGDDTLLRQAIQAGAAALTGNIAALQAIVPGADKVPYWSSSSSASLTTFIASSFSRGLMANTSLATWQTALGISAAGKPNVISFGNLVSAADTIGYFTNNSGGMAVTGFTAAARSVLDDTTVAAMRATLGVTGAYTDFSALTLTALVPLILNGAQMQTTGSPPTLIIYNRSNSTGYVGITGNFAPAFSAADGAYLICYGDDHATALGNLVLVSGSSGEIRLNGNPISAFATGTNAANLTGVVPAACIQGANVTNINAANITTGTLAAARMAATQTEINTIQQNTANGADNAYTAYAGGGAVAVDRGAYLAVYGNEHATAPGRVHLISGSTGYVLIQSGGSVNVINDQAFTGTGSAITNLNASNISSGALDPTRIATGSLSISKLADINTDRLLGNVSGVTGPVAGLAAASAWAILGTAAGSALNSMTLTSTDAATAPAPNVIMRRDSSSPAAADNLGAIYFQGNNAAGSNATYAQISCQIVTTTAGAHDGKLIFTAYNNANNTNVMTLTAGVIVGGPSGGDKGIGTLNAVALYDDNVLLTCLPLQSEFLEQGKVDLARWDSFAMHGRHEAAHKFIALLEDGVDPRDPMKFIAKMKQLQALPGMPTQDDWEHGSMSMGEMFNRLWLAVEMLAVAWMSHVESERETRH